MKKLLLAAVAASAMAATPAMAATDAEYSVTGTVGAACTITATGTLAFGTLTDGSGAFAPQTANPSSTDSAAYCNQAATTITVTKTDPSISATSAGFSNTFTITPKVTTPQNTTGFTGVVTDGAIGAFTSLTVSVTATAPANKLLAGSYNNGKVNITLTPAS